MIRRSDFSFSDVLLLCAALAYWSGVYHKNNDSIYHTQRITLKEIAKSSFIIQSDLDYIRGF